MNSTLLRCVPYTPRARALPTRRGAERCATVRRGADLSRLDLIHSATGFSTIHHDTAVITRLSSNVSAWTTHNPLPR